MLPEALIRKLPGLSRAFPSLREVVLLGFLVVALFAYGWAPGVAWAMGIAVCVMVLIFALREASREDRRWMFICAVVSAISFGVTLALFGYEFPASSDPELYMAQSGALSEAWRGGWYPAISQKGSLPYMGTLHTGYQRVLALLFLATGGPRAETAIFLNGICLVWIPIAVFQLARELWWEALEEREATPQANRLRYAPHLSAALMAVYPTLFYWGRFVLKDVVLTAVFVTAAWILLRTLRRRSMLDGAVFICLALFCTSVRAYAGLSLFLAVGVYGVALLPRRWVFATLAWSLIVLALATYTGSLGSTLSQLWSSAIYLLPEGSTSTAASLKTMAIGVPRLLLGPYAWVLALRPEEMFNTLYGLYPGMWMLYLVVYAPAAAGVWFAMRINHMRSIVPLICIAVAAMLFLVSYGGLAMRQRLYLEPFLFCYAGVGWTGGRPARWLTVWYLALFLFASGQLLSL